MAATGLLLVGLLLVARPVVQAQGAPVLSAQVLGPNVTFTWTAVAGATEYVLRAGVAPGVYIFPFNVGNTTTVGASAPSVGTYYVVVDAVVNGAPVRSNELTVVVTSMFVPPAAPTALEGFLNGTSVLLTWALGSGGGAPTNLLLYAGTTPGGSDVGIFALAGNATQMSAANVPARTYYLRLVAQNQGGTSPASNEVVLTMPAGGGCSAPPARAFTASAFGTYAQFRWAGVPGASSFILDFGVQGQGITYRAPVGGNSTSFAVRNAPLGNFYGRMITAFSCGTTTQGPDVPFTIDGAPPPGPRAPNPAPGTRLPFPSWGAGIVQQLAAERPDLLRQSCHEQPGGNNRFMFEAARRLRARDNRFGLNWKRGLVGDLSQDIVNYNYGSESDEGTRQVYIIDMIGGHCGPNPSWAWIDQTDATRNAGTIGIWTLIPYLDAGYPIVSDPQQDPQ
jgi:hypothetical protein